MEFKKETLVGYSIMSVCEEPNQIRLLSYMSSRGNAYHKQAFWRLSDITYTINSVASTK